MGWCYFFVAAPLTNWNGSDAGIPFLAAVFTRSRGRSKLNYSSSQEQIRKRGGPRIFSSVSASTLILCERRGRGTSELRACAGTPNNRDSVRFPAQANSTAHSCLLHDHGTRTPCCFFESGSAPPMETSLDVSPRPGGAKKDVNSRQQIEAGHQLTGFCRTCDNVTESGHSLRMMKLLDADWRSSKSATRT